MINVYRWDSTGAVTTESTRRPRLPDDPGAWLWIDIADESFDEVTEIGRSLGLDDGAIEEMAVETHLPMIEEYTNQVFVVLHGVTTGSGGRLETPQTKTLLGDQVLLTIRDGSRASVDTLQHKIATEGQLPIESPAELLGLLALTAGRNFGALIPELARQIDSLEELALQGDPRTAVEVLALRRDVIYLSQVLRPQFDVVEDLSESGHGALNDGSRKVFARVAAQHRRALESLDSSRALLGSVLETYRGAVADQTNEIMRVLTVFSAILLPLSLIAGLWGMNFIRIPGSSVDNGFWILLGIMALLAVAVWIYFTRRGFIGAPRLRELPKAVGLGLFAIGTAPIRVVADGLRQLGGTEDTDVGES